MPVLFAQKKKHIIHRPQGRSRIAQLVLVLLGIELLFLSAFTAFNLPTATAHNWQCYARAELHKLYCHLPIHLQSQLQSEFPNPLLSAIAPDTSDLHNVRFSLYVPQAPAAIFLGYILGLPLAVIAAAIYMLLGLFGPVIKIYPFASGSGIGYYLQPSFGYLIGTVVAAGCVGYISQGKRTSARQLLSVLAGLLCVHGIGLCYMLGICLFGSIYSTTTAQLSWSGWLFEEIRNLSWYAIPYDFIFSLGLIGVSFMFRSLVAVLTAPDIGTNNGPNQENNENLVDFQSALR